MLVLIVGFLAQSDVVTGERLIEHVRFLAAPDMKGRDNDTPESRKAAAYVAQRFAEIGLRPAGARGYFQDFTLRERSGRNVIGLLDGRGEEYVVVAAHHDGLGVKDGKVHPGADDNASGVAAVIELARAFSESKPRRSVLFISFDGEEDGFLGSRSFVASGLRPVESCAAMFVFDLIGGDFFPWEKKRVYALGSEYSDALFTRVGAHAVKSKDVEVVRSGVFLLEPVPGMARSDYHPFRGRGVPFVFFSTGTPWYYHTEHDTIARLNVGKMEAAVRFAYGVIAETAEAEARPRFRKPPLHPENIAIMREMLGRVLENKDRIRIEEEHLAEIRSLHEELGEMKEPKRARLQRGMILLFAVARSQGEK